MGIGKLQSNKVNYRRVENKPVEQQKKPELKVVKSDTKPVAETKKPTAEITNASRTKTLEQQRSVQQRLLQQVPANKAAPTLDAVLAENSQATIKKGQLDTVARVEKDGVVTQGSVREVQALLNKNKASDPPLKVDGDFRDQTEAAVKAFQEKNGLAADGVVNKATLEKLREGATKVDTDAKNTEALKDLPPETQKEVQSRLDKQPPISDAARTNLLSLASSEGFKKTDPLHQKQMLAALDKRPEDPALAKNLAALGTNTGYTTLSGDGASDGMKTKVIEALAKTPPDGQDVFMKAISSKQWAQLKDEDKPMVLALLSSETETGKKFREEAAKPDNIWFSEGKENIMGDGYWSLIRINEYEKLPQAEKDWAYPQPTRSNSSGVKNINEERRTLM